MRRILFVFPIVCLGLIGVCAQPNRTVRSTPPAAKPVAAGALADRGRVIGRTYTNNTFRFEVTFPDEWLIPGDDFEDYMKKQGFDVSLKAPANLSPAAKAAVTAAIKRLQIVMTAYSSMPGTPGQAVVRVAFESLAANPQIKDGVDYCDAIRSTYGALRLPAGSQVSETQAEKLGKMQFAFLDSTSGGSKMRTYVTVRNGYAILFRIDYKDDADLQVLRKVLSDGNFDLK